MKTCARCGLNKPLGEFGRNSSKRDGLQTHCKECRSEYQKTWYSENHEVQAERVRRSRKPGRYLFERYGITLVEKQALIDKQNGVCPICGTAVKMTSHLDHAHETGRVRGVLCLHCNIGLGHFKDDPRSLAHAIEYLNAV